jgi:hypothetical protein
MIRDRARKSFQELDEFGVITHKETIRYMNVRIKRSSINWPKNHSRYDNRDNKNYTQKAQ